MARLHALAGLSLLLSTMAFAQLSGRLTGTVVDPANASVPGAKISLFLEDGKTAVLSGTTNAEGHFDFIAVRPETYRVEVEAPGFNKFIQGGLKVDAARETNTGLIKLSLAAASVSVEVSTAVTSVETTNAEVSSTVSQEQVMNLPVLDRQLVSLFYTQAGVTANLRSATVINGVRPSYTNVVLDGINLQDSVRTNAIDYMPNKLTISQVAEFTVATSNANLTIGGGASTIIMSTPSGTNQLHGSGYWYNRNNHFAANDWFNNKDEVSIPFLNLNQVGGTLGGHIIKDKLFFYGAYEAYRLKQTTPETNTILTPTARQGILQYRVGGAVQQFDVLKAYNLSVNPVTQSLLSQVPTTGNSTDVGDGLNTTGYSFNARNNETRDNVSAKVDYNLSVKHVFQGSYVWNRDIVDRPDYEGFYTTVPVIYNDGTARLVSGSWRWNPIPTLTNEVRGGFNRTFAPFISRENYTFVPSDTLFTAPVVSGVFPQGRHVNTYILQDNASWLKGKHTLAFGFQTNQLRTNSYDYSNTIPKYTVGVSSTSPYGFKLGDIPGATSTYINTANSLLATMAGLVSSGSQTFNATGQSSGYVAGAPNSSQLKFNQYALYLADTLKARRNLTLTLGLRWDYFAPVDETDGLMVAPVLVNNNPVETLRGNITLDLTGGPTGRALYNKDLNNFAPNIGFAWDVFGDGKTAVRGAYSIAYVNDNTLNSIQNTTTYINPGLSTAVNRNNLNARLDAPPSITPPPFQIPITAQTLFNNSPSSPSVFGMIDPNLRTPYVQQWSFGIEREIRGVVAEVRYVGNHAVKMFRNQDFNQINVFQKDFLADFIRARNNGFLSASAGRGFVPTYNPAIAGSQQLTFFPLLPNGGSLSNASIQSSLRSGEIGTLAQTYQSNLYFPSPGFSYFPNPLALYESYLTNYSNASYNSIQMEVRKRTAHDFQFQASYVFSKALSDATAFRSLDPILDNNNPSIERARPTYDLTHSFKLNHYLPLPLGPGHRLTSANAVVKRLLGGWGASGILFIQSGSPVAVYSARGTLNRGARSGTNTVDTNSTQSQLNSMTGKFDTGDTLYWFDPRHIGSDGRAVAPDGSAPFSGQVFFEPQPGSLGALQRRVFDGPGFWTYSFSIGKRTQITERHSLEFRADFYNLFNHPTFYLDDQTVTSASFGKISSQNYTNEGIGPRLVQFGLYYRF